MRRLLYNDVGNTLRITRADTTYTAMTYDAMDRVLTTRNPNNEVTTFTYFADGSLASLKDARNSLYSFTVDGRSRRTRMTYPGGSFENWTYDAAGNLSLYTARNGVSRTCTYDNRDRELTCNWSDSTPDVARTYDAASRLITSVNGVSSLSYTYNNANELLSETQNIVGGPGAKTVAYIYNVDGLRTTLGYPGGAVATTTYSNNNRVATIVGNQLLASMWQGYAYDPAGRTRLSAFPAGILWSYQFDPVGRVDNAYLQNYYFDTTPFFYDYTYDDVDRKTSTRQIGSHFEEILSHDFLDNYTYDAADQLTGLSSSTQLAFDGSAASRAVTHAYDAVGNRTAVTDVSTTTPYTSNALNQYTSIDGLSTPQYSTNGNLTQVQYPAVGGFAGISGPSSIWTYTYDSQNRLLSATNGTVNASFAYDARNRQVSRTIGGVTTWFIYDGWNLLEEYTVSSNTVPTRAYLHSGEIDKLIGYRNSNEPDYFYATLTDERGTSLGLWRHNYYTDWANLERYRYDAYGAVTITDANGAVLPSSAAGNRFLYTGREWIAELGIYDYRNRQYSPQLGRFLQTDPIRFEAGDVNLYRYVGNIPNSYRDPLGLLIPPIVAPPPVIAPPNPYVAAFTFGVYIGEAIGESPFGDAIADWLSPIPEYGPLGQRVRCHKINYVDHTDHTGQPGAACGDCVYECEDGSQGSIPSYSNESECKDDVFFDELHDTW